MNQSVKEAELNLPLSPFMLNLDKEIVMAKNELGFLKFMVQPLYKSISESFIEDPISGLMFKNVNNNIEWYFFKLIQLGQYHQGHIGLSLTGYQRFFYNHKIDFCSFYFSLLKFITKLFLIKN